MILFKQKASKKARIAAARRQRWNQQIKPNQHFLAARQFFYGIIFVFYAALLVFVGFYEQSPMSTHLGPGQIPKSRILAEFPFSYESKLRRESLIAEKRQQVAPFYQLEQQFFYNFRDSIRELSLRLDLLAVHLQEIKDPQEATDLIEQFEKKAEKELHLALHTAEIKVFLNLPEQDRQYALREGIVSLQETLEKGVIAQPLEGEEPAPVFLKIQTETKNGPSIAFLEEDALIQLRRDLRTLDLGPATLSALFQLLKQGVRPNLVFDEELTQEHINHVADSVGPVWVNVEAGQEIASGGSRLTAEQSEMLSAYRHEIRTRGDFADHLDRQLIEQWVCTLALLLVALMFVRLALRELITAPLKLIVCALSLLLGTILMRIILEWDNWYWTNQISLLGAILRYLVPAAFPAMLAVLLVGSAGGILVAFLSSVFFAMMVQGDIALTLLFMLVAFVGMRLTRGARVRGAVVRAGLISGLVMAGGALFLGITTLSWHTIIQQMAAAFIIGGLSALGAIAILPLCEHLFKITTDITLLELTDFNHPLLRRLQAVAPGTYHHSLMVANLAEAAAEKIGANSLVCRACALFHDIGKMVKPEYFVENQQEGLNPHNDRTPSMSALVIKNHVKEGVEIARQAKLPKIIIDVIEQHHSTSLMQYFYTKARQQCHTIGRDGSNPAFDPAQIDEATYRYDGPKPCFAESVIIFLADPLEAASRTLKKVTPQKVDELIERIFAERFADHQLDEAPLTIQQIQELKKVFAFILLNMLHSRAEYPPTAHIKEGELA